MSGENHLGYVRDVAYLLRGQIVDAEQKARAGSAFDEGRAFGLRQALSCMQQQGRAFDLPTHEVCLDGFDAMTDSVELPPSKTT